MIEFLPALNLPRGSGRGKKSARGEEGKPQQFLVRDTSKSPLD